MIHQLACVDSKAKIGENVTIEPFSTIAGDVEIGDGTWIGSNVTIMEGARIGKNCKIFPGAVIAAIPQDLKFAGEVTTVEIGDGTTIRECCTINRGTVDKLKTVIGKNCLLMAYCHVAHDCVVGDNVVMANVVQLAGHVEVGDHAVIGGMTAVHQFVKIGTHTMIAAQSFAVKDVPPFVTAGREPMAYMGVNSTGLRRRGFSNEQINHIQDLYRTVFQKGLNYGQAKEALASEFEATEEQKIVLDFLESSNRGLIK